MPLPLLDSDRSTREQPRSSPAHLRGGRTNLLTVSLEDYFQAGAFGKLIPRGQWYRYESRIEKGTNRVLELLDEFGISATFFVLGCVAERYPELVRSVRDRGHEIASKGYQHRLIGELSRAELSEDLIRAREAIESAGGERVQGCRISGWLSPNDAWALDVMAEQGYAYDSSMRPIFRSHAAVPESRRAHVRRVGDRSIWEFPVSSVTMLGCDIPLAGGNWFRQLPHGLVRRGIARCHRDETAPVVLYFQSWELDPEQPRIDAASRTARLRHYRNLDRMPAILRHYLARYSFTGIAEWLEVPVAVATTPTHERPALRVSQPTRASALLPAAPSLPRLVVSVVIPCFNEERGLPYLANTLHRLEDTLGGAYDLRFFVVDDGSTDDSSAVMRTLFASWASVTVLRHSRNRGMAAAIRTGVLAANTDIVCSMDCDCAYDPHELARMIPRLRAEVDLVVASPYHPDGAVRNVSAGRRVLSRTLARLYRLVLRHQLHTYTSGFRVYRRSRLLSLNARRDGFIGQMEMLALLDFTGASIVEHPVTLEARMFGRSKADIVRRVAGHLGLIAELLWLRARA